MQIQLSISVLVSDRIGTANKCLNSLVPILQKIPSELIVVYTGNNLESYEIAKRYTDHIIPFTWCDDFSKARNTGLEEASGEWFMFIDDDEWFDSCTEIIEFFQSDEYKNYNSGEYLVRNYFDLNGINYEEAYVARMVKNRKETKFCGIVHEALQPVFSPTKYFNCFVHHYGYAVGNKEKKVTSSTRNIPLLEKQIELQPKESRYYAQLAQEYYGMQEFEKSADYCRKILEMDQQKWNDNYVCWSAAYLISSLSISGKYEEALKDGLTLLSFHQLGELYKLYIYIALAPACRSTAKYEQGIEQAKHFILLRKKLDAKLSMWNEQQLLHINKATIEKLSYILFSNAILCATQLNDFESVEYLLKEYKWDSEIEKKDMYSFINGYKEMFPADYETIITAFSKVESENGFILLQKALFYEMKKDSAKAESMYLQCQKVCESFYYSQLVLLAIRNHFELPEFLQDMDLDDWRGYSQAVAESYKFVDFFAEMENISQLFVSYPMHKAVLQQKISARVLYSEDLSHHDFIRTLHEYCNVVLSFNHILYKDEMFTGPMQYCLPKECRAALMFQNVLDMLTQEKILKCIERLRTLLHTYPYLAYIVRRMTDYIKEEFYEDLESKYTREFYETGQKVKEIMKQLAEDEKYQDAYDIAEKLGVLQPLDTEVIRYKQLLRRMID